MQQYLFLAGPPCGKRMWTPTIERMRSQGKEATPIDILDLGTHLNDPQEWIAALGQRIADHAPCVLVAHGTAVPLACHASAHTHPEALVLSNGPLGSLPPAARALTRTLRTLGPTAILKWLSSAAGLRRTVVNPYVWDHDTVVTICGPLFENPDSKNCTRTFLQHLPKWAKSQPKPQVPTALIWGDTDRVFGSLNEDYRGPNTTQIIIDGGQHSHPIERPWEIADRTVDWAEKNLTTT